VLETTTHLKCDGRWLWEIIRTISVRAMTSEAEYSQLFLKTFEGVSKTFRTESITKYTLTTTINTH